MNGRWPSGATCRRARWPSSPRPGMMAADQGAEEGNRRARRDLATSSEHVTEHHDDALISTTPRDAARSTRNHPRRAVQPNRSAHRRSGPIRTGMGPPRCPKLHLTQRLRWSVWGVEPPAGIEPATPSLPWIGGPAPCYRASSQLAAHRGCPSYGLSSGTYIPSVPTVIGGATSA
jgi:hypothetical protein